jgi:hypothetical protein
MSAVDTAILATLVRVAIELHEPGEGAGEYTRGQAELIGDACGLPMDVAHDVLMPLLYGGPPRNINDRVTTAYAAEVTAQVMKANREYRA